MTASSWIMGDKYDRVHFHESISILAMTINQTSNFAGTLKGFLRGCGRICVRLPVKTPHHPPNAFSGAQTAPDFFCLPIAEQLQNSGSNALATCAKALIYAPSCLREICSPVAQLVEQAAVNRWVAGSSPARGATHS